MVWGSFLIAAAALKTTTRNGDNAQVVNLTFRLGLTRLLCRFSAGDEEDLSSFHVLDTRTWTWRVLNPTGATRFSRRSGMYT